jgi:MoaA/NifB/PqqE/SkfB family radical SAM enzyme
MPINELDLLLTYKCNLECDHCFVFGSPDAGGVMKISDIREILEEAKKIRSIDWIYIEGGEPVLYYPILLWGLREAKKLGFKTGFITNAYWATSIEDAKEWLKPIAEIGISNAIISDDLFHYGKEEENLSKYAYQAAKELGSPSRKGLCSSKGGPSKNSLKACPEHRGMSLTSVWTRISPIRSEYTLTPLGMSTCVKA